MSIEALGPLAAAVDVALRADGPLVAHLGGANVFSALVEEDLDLDDYIVLASKDSGPPFLRFNQQKGEALAITIRAIQRIQRSDGKRIEGDGPLVETVGHIARILVHNPLTLNGYGQVAIGEVFLQGTGVTPNGERIVGVVRYEATCRKTS